MPTTLKRLLAGLLGLFLLLNAFAAWHAWHFTHMDPQAPAIRFQRQYTPAKLLKAVFWGFRSRKAKPYGKPAVSFEEASLNSGKYRLNGWVHRNPESNSWVLLFHGYRAEKSTMRCQFNALAKAGYSVATFDLRAHGHSEGRSTSIGYYEAQDVAAVYRWVKKQHPEAKVVLHGTSMGAVAILRAVAEKGIAPAGVVVQAPYRSMLSATRARFRVVGVPAFPLAELLVFWGGVEQGFNGFAVDAADYARQVHCPVLHFWSPNDGRVSQAATQKVFAAFPGPKQLAKRPASTHNSYCWAEPQAYNRLLLQWLNQKAGLH